MAKVIEGRCGNCVAWHPADAVGPVTIGATKRGTCHMLPPTPHPVYDTKGGIVGQRNFWPGMREDDMCLSFAPRQGIAEGATIHFGGPANGDGN